MMGTFEMEKYKGKVFALHFKVFGKIEIFSWVRNVVCQITYFPT